MGSGPRRTATCTPESLKKNPRKAPNVDGKLNDISGRSFSSSIVFFKLCANVPAHRAASGRRNLNSLAIAPAVFACCFGAAMAGMALAVRLPDRYLDGDSKDVMKLVMGLIATMAALVLGL